MITVIVYSRKDCQLCDQAISDLDAIQSASAGQAWTAISFVVAERRVLGFVLTPTAPSPATFAVDIAPAELASRIGAYREMVERRQDGTRDEARALYDLLWKPVEALAGKFKLNRIGRVCAGRGLFLITSDKKKKPLRTGGFEHFS